MLMNASNSNVTTSNGYKFTYIIGYRHSNERIINLKRVLDWVTRFNGVEIILVEQDVSPKIPTFSLFGFKYIFTKSEMPYNRSWAFNVGLKSSTTEIVVFGDSDLIMNPNDLINSLNLLNQYDCVSPYTSVLDLDQRESNLPFDKLISIPRPGRGETDNQKINLCGGIVLYRKESALKIGGWNERFIGWGGEDNYQEFKTKNLLTWVENNARCYHLWHTRTPPDNKWYTRTMELLNKLVSMSTEDTIKIINVDIPKIGAKNKYS
jgi:hypothetical protein